MCTKSLSSRRATSTKSKVKKNTLPEDDEEEEEEEFTSPFKGALAIS